MPDAPITLTDTGGDKRISGTRYEFRVPFHHSSDGPVVLSTTVSVIAQTPSAPLIWAGLGIEDTSGAPVSSGQSPHALRVACTNSTIGCTSTQSMVLPQVPAGELVAVLSVYCVSATACAFTLPAQFLPSITVQSYAQKD